MAVPPIAPVPPASVRNAIADADWESFLDAWLALSQLYLRLPSPQFAQIICENGPLIRFLVTFFQELSSAPNDTRFQGTKASLLKKNGFLLAHRALSSDSVSPELLHWKFLAHLSYLFPRTESLRDLLRDIWQKKSGDVTAGLQKTKNELISTLESGDPEPAGADLKPLAYLLHVSPDACQFLMAGSDFLDAACASYKRESPSLRKNLVTVVYVGMVGLVSGPKKNYSMLSDLLYSLKNDAESKRTDADQATLISDLVTNTPLIDKVNEFTSPQEGGRARNAAASLRSFYQPAIARPKRLVRRKIDKGKSRAAGDDFGHETDVNVHVHRMSLVTQIQDLFPDLGSGFVIKLLDAYHDNVEQVTEHLLEDTLPPHLAEADRSEQLSIPSSSPTSHLPPRSTPPPERLHHIPERKNVFDNDAFDRLEISTSQLHIGRKNQEATADDLLRDRSHAPDKARILSALAAFDSDDDERDDTYDVADVGGTVDRVPEDEEAAAIAHEKNEEALYKAYTVNPDTFNRDATTRRGAARQALKSETGMTDEAIEGWRVMLDRDPKRLRRLEMKFTAFHGQQKQLERTAWRASDAADGDTSGTGTDGGRGGRGGFGRRGGFRGGGRGRGGGAGGGGGGRSGDSGGPSDEKRTQVDRQRKEAHKCARANHNRRDQRARKVARAGFPG